MTVQEDIFTLGKKKFNQVKALVDELEVQLALGKADARKTIENERKNFIAYVRERRDALRNASTDLAKDKDDLLKKFDALEEKLQAETADKKDQFDTQKEAILHAIYEVENAMKNYYGELAMDVQQYIDTFKTKLDGYRIQLALSKFDEAGNVEAKKTELRDAVGVMREQLSKEDSAKQKYEAISNELNEAFDHLKKAFKEVLN